MEVCKESRRRRRGTEGKQLLRSSRCLCASMVKTSLPLEKHLLLERIADGHHNHRHNQNQQSLIQKSPGDGWRALPLATPQSPEITHNDGKRNEQRPARHYTPVSELGGARSV